MKRSQGFTLIEMMTVIAIIAILASLAITAYSKSISKAQLAEVFTSIDGLKSDVLEYYHQTGNCPSIGSPLSGLAGNDASYSGRYVASTDITSQSDSCTITLTMRTDTVAIPLRGKKVIFVINAMDQGTSHWSCNSDVSPIYLPQTCQ